MPKHTIELFSHDSTAACAGPIAASRDSCGAISPKPAMPQNTTHSNLAT